MQRTPPSFLDPLGGTPGPLSTYRRRPSRCRFLLSALLLCTAPLLPASVRADGVYWACNFGSKSFFDRGVSCEQTTDCKSSTLRCSEGFTQLFSVDDFADTIAVSPDGRYIVGLSNMGSKNAFWIRDRTGKVLAYKPHNDGQRRRPDGKGGFEQIPAHSPLKFPYCQQSVTNIRKWYDAAQPSIRFTVKSGELVQVTVRSCKGKDISLMQ